MSRFSFFLRQLVTGPASLFSGPVSFLRDIYTRSQRGKAFILALPALFMIFFGCTLLLASQLGRENRLIQKYDNLAKASDRAVESLLTDFSKAQRFYHLELMKGDNTPDEIAAILRSDPSKDTIAAGQGQTEVREISTSERAYRKLQSRIGELRISEKLYLQKLIELAPSDGSYKFRYAKAHFPLNQEIVPELMSALAPIEDGGLRVSNQIGNPEAHLWMAKHFAALPKANERELQLALMMIEKHASRCLVVDSGNREARELRAQVLQIGKQYSRAYDDYSVLFELNPRYFSNLVQLNQLINREPRNAEVLDQAATRLHREIVSNRENLAAWETAWQTYADCMMRRKRFTLLRQELQLERDMFGTDQLKRNFLNSILGAAFSSRVAELQATVKENPVDADEVIQILEEAANSAVLNDFMKFQCAYLDREVPAVSTRAKALYDYRQDPDPPALVMDVIAQDAMEVKDFAQAVSVLERARAKAPNSPVILNNLAYSYLSLENTNPTRALEMTEQAIRMISAGQFSKEEMSHYLHTQGVALMQLNRMDEAEGALLEALKGRPGNVNVLNSLIRCYEGRDEIQRGIFQRELESVMAEMTQDGKGKK